MGGRAWRAGRMQAHSSVFASFWRDQMDTQDWHALRVRHGTSRVRLPRHHMFDVSKLVSPDRECALAYKHVHT
eukprot:1948570-Pleurochrysis_carterae.AAC.1